MEISDRTRACGPGKTRLTKALRLPLVVTKRLKRRVSGRAFASAGAVGLLLLLTVAYFWPFVFLGEVIAPTDLLLKYPPWSSLAPEGFTLKNHLRSDIVDGALPKLSQYREAVTQGGFPLWSPLEGQGRPFATQLLRSFFYPLTALIVLFPVAQGFSLMMMAKLFLSGLFMHLFLRRLDVGHAGSLLGGIAYMFSGFNIVWLMWRHTAVSSFAPLLFLQTENLLRRPTLGNTALLSLVIAVMVLAGFPAVAGYFFYAVGLYFIVRLAQIFLKDRQVWTALRTGGAFGLSFTLGAGLTAFQVLPTLELADFVDIGSRSALSLYSLPDEQAVQLVFPNFFGNQVFGAFHGRLNLNETSGYVGIITLVIALFGLLLAVRRQRISAAFFGGLAFIPLLIIYDIGPFPSLIRQLPVFDLNSNIRTLSVFGFAAAAMAAFGLDDLLRIRLTGWSHRIVPLALSGLAAVLAAAVAILASQMNGKRAILRDILGDLPFVDLQFLGSLDFESFRLATVAFGITIVLLFVLLLAFHFRRPLPATVLAAGILVLVIGDLFVFAYRQNPTVPSSYFYPTTPAIEFLQENASPYERVASFDFTFMRPGTEAFYGLSSPFSHTLYPQRQRQLITAFSEEAFRSATALSPLSRSTRFDSPIIDLLGIKFVTVASDVDLFQTAPALEDHYELVYANPLELRIYRNRDFAPAFVVPSIKLEENPATILGNLQQSDFDPRAVAFIEEPSPAGWFAGEGSSSPSAASVRVKEYGFNSITYEVDTDTKALLVTHELYYPGWSASVDSDAVEIYRTNYIFRGVFVDPGHHEVRFTYRPASFNKGVVISAVTLFGVAGLVAFDWTRKRLRLGQQDAS